LEEEVGVLAGAEMPEDELDDEPLDAVPPEEELLD
jgi:hypothetical protein